MDSISSGAKASQHEGAPSQSDTVDAFPVEAQARRSPQSLAVVFRDKHLTYAELDARANRLAQYLQKLGVGPEVLVGICLERGIEAIVAIVGVLKAGGAYVPLDPEYPQQRLAYLVADTRVAILLTQHALLDRVSTLAAEGKTPKTVCLDDEWSAISDEPSDSPTSLATDANLAYVIHTSGSTGEPKGVMIERRGLRNMAEATFQAFALQPGDRVLQFSSLSFDASVFEIFMALRAGATLIIAPPESRVPGPALAHLLRERELTIVTLPPSVLATLPAQDLPSLRIVTVAGEACSAELVERWAPGRRFFNLYGPTEATVWATVAECIDGRQKPSIGKAIRNTRVWLLDRDLRPVPPGQPGELHLGGVGVARGYLNRPELTAEKFSPDPFSTEPGERLYKTGDICRLLPDGNIDFIGREDDQVKLRGFRIELGEVEAAVRSHPGVRDAVVALKQGATGEQKLVAYIVLDDESASRLQQVPALRQYLERKLPPYMVPVAFVPMAALPLTIQGKVDRRALPEPETGRSQLSSDYEAPRTPFEASLAAVWEGVLHVERVGVHDDFFELGGNSLAGAVLLNSLQKMLGVQLYIVALFDAPTVAEQAAYLSEYFPDAIGALVGGRRPGSVGQPGSRTGIRSAAERIAEREIEDFRKSAAAWHMGEGRRVRWSPSRNAGMAFILTPPRSGSSLLRIMLGGHPQLFAPPELELLSFDTLAQRRDRLSGRLGFMREGLVRALMEIRQCDAGEAERIMTAHEARGESVQAFYRLLQEWIGERLLVDKSTTYALSREALDRAEEGFGENVYIHLVRHPYGTIRSFEEARLDRVLTFHVEHEHSVRQFAELTWIISHRNILGFLSKVPSHRQIRVRFEDLVRNPRPVMEAICRRLKVEFDPVMLEPYRHQERRMTDGAGGLSVGMTDPKFHSHSDIDPEVADSWQESYTEDFLSAAAWGLARDLGYEYRVPGGAASVSGVSSRLTPAITPTPRDPENPPLQSYGQQRLWFIDRLAPGNPSYNTSRVIQIDGPLDVALLERSLNEIVRRHEVCRTNFAIRNGQPVQIIHPARPLALRRADISGVEAAAQQVELERIAAVENMASFDLARDHLWRALLVRVSNDRHVLFFCIHHIVSDAWSRAVIHQELSALYSGFAEGNTSPVPELPIQYADYAAWQREVLGGPEGRRLRSYWLEQVHDAPPMLTLPTDRPRPRVQTHEGASGSFRLSDPLVRKVRALGHQEGATLFMTLLCAFNVLLCRYSGQSDIVVGVPVSGRNRAELERLVGFFVNVLPIRTRIPADGTFRGLLRQVRDTCRSGFAHQDYPFDFIVSGLKLNRALDHHPLFQVAFALQQPLLQDLDLPGLQTCALNVGPRPTPYDITMVAVEEPGGLEVVIDYNVALFDAGSIERLAEHYVNLLKEIVEAPDRSLSALAISFEAVHEAETRRTESDERAPLGKPGGEEKESGNRRELLRRLLAQEIIDSSRLPITPREAGREVLPLSFAQEELWLLDQMDPGNIAFNIGLPPLRLEGQLNPDALERALNEIVRRHEILRTAFPKKEGQPVQEIASKLVLSLPSLDLNGGAPSEREAEIERLFIRELEAPFDLARGPLIRAKLLRLDASAHVLLLVMHHIIFDASSGGMLFQELATLYKAFSSGEPSPLADLPVQYADFALWQRRWLQSAGLRKQLAYWKERLQGVPALHLPADHPRPAAPSYRATGKFVFLSKEASEALRSLSRREGVTMFVTMLASFKVLLCRYSQQNDIIVGLPVTSRRCKELEGLIGFFINMVVARSDLSGELTFRELLSRVREVALGALENSEVPFEMVVQEIRPHRGLARNPLFQVAFSFESRPPQAHDFSDLKASTTSEIWRISRFDVEAYVRDTADGFKITLVGVTDLFDGTTIAQMLAHYRLLLEEIAADPNRRISELSLLTRADRDRLLVEWNRAGREYPRDVCVHQVFEEQVRRGSEAVAADFGDARLSYAELNARANRLAHHLRALGVGPDVLVGLCMERSSAALVAMLGILKAGGAYVPLDPEYPVERLALMLQDTEAPVVVAQSSLLARLPDTGAKIVCMDRDWPVIEGCSAENPASGAGGGNLAYVIYTSGSTGTPKGVQVTHRAINRLVCNTDYVDIRPADRFAQASVMSFDAATFEIWGGLLNGACVVGVSRDVSLSPREFADFLRERGITVMFLTTALFNLMAREAPGAFQSLRYVLFGGEAVDVGSVRAVLRDGPPQHLLHVYGPTEVTTFSTWHRVADLDDAASTVPIGRPIANTTAYVLDEHRQPVPVGVSGELYLGGDGLARGYLKRPELTARHFVEHPFSAEPGARLYRTGDWVRYRADGSIEFIGRRDNQVKVRGFRIELGEIEATLGRLPEVRESVVVVREDEPGDRRVVVYWVPADGQGRTSLDLRGVLRQRLPDYMVPSACVALDRLPLTSNGKVDRSALPPPQSERQLEHGAVAPRSELEEGIARIWREVLHLENVGVRDNFFDLGGHSLLLVKAHARLCAELDCKLEVVDLFTYPTIEALAKHLTAARRTSALVEEARARVSRRSKSFAQGEPIAIIGMAGRFPGAGNIESLWANLRRGEESIVFFGREEMRESGVPDAALNDPNYVGARGYLEDADKFDAVFFGYSAREAELMDPQHRLLLECASDALENAGYDPERYRGPIGAYAGSSINTYLSSLVTEGGPHASSGGLSRVLASGQDFLTTRLSYKLNLRGPSMNVQTACSTSLVAVHEACRALRDHECDMAVAGGVSVTVPVKSGYVYVQEGIGSADGHCRAFDAGASGTVGGNGVALVVLKRLSEALADGDHIHAVIHGSAINNDGSSKVGYTAPSVEGQAEAIALAQAAAGFDPDTIGYVEAHGTGTLLGDPIEISALRRVFGDGPRRSGTCWLGSVKTNVGHLDAAAGVAGLIKATLSLEHKELVPSLNFSKPNPQIDFAAGPFQVNTELRPWKSPSGVPRRAGVSSFGLGGTNAHVVLEEAPSMEPSDPAREWQLICLSAKTASALERATANLARHLGACSDINLADAAFTLQVGRREFSHRRVVVCRDVADAVSALQGSAPERASSGIFRGGERSVVFMFSGQGVQYPNMGLGLYRNEAVFRETIDQSCEKLKRQLNLDLREVLYPADDALEKAAEQLKRTELTQPALFVVEYALANLWMSFGIRPAAMIGHSIGEYVAACLAGVLSVDDALALVAERGRLMGQLPAGAMLAVPLSEPEVRFLVGERLSVAAINTPSLCVVSGPEEDIAALEARLLERELQPRRLHTSHAFHSSMMDPILAPFAQRVREISLNRPRLPYVSNVTGDWITAEQATDPSYYATHLRQAVRFAKGLEQLLVDPRHVFLEVGPGHTLTALAKRHPAKRDEHEFIASLRHADDRRADEEFLMQSVGRLWLAGMRPDWSALHGGHRRQRVRLPTYPFERTRYWIESNKTPAGRERVGRKADPAEWIYVPSWRRAPAPPGGSGTHPASWLCFADGHGLGSCMEAELVASGANVVSVSLGDGFARRDDGRYTLNPGEPKDYNRLVADLFTHSRIPEFIVHLWSVNSDDELRADEKVRAKLQDCGFFSLVFLVQALEARGVTSPLKLAVVSTHVHEVNGGEVLCPEKAMVLGPCKVIGMEYPNIRTRAIDVTLDGDLHRLARALTLDLRAPWADPVVAYRGRYRWVQAFERTRLEALAGVPAVLREAGVYLITGGLGGVGLEIAEYLARTVRARLALVSRTPLPDREQWPRWLADHDESDPTARKIRRVQAIEAAGGAVLLYRADVSDERGLATAIAETEARFGPLNGVMHAAGAEKRGAPIRSLQRAECEEQFRAKQLGLRVLAKVLHGKALDFCLVHSSLASVLGVVDFVSYTASHLFMDAFVHWHRRETGIPWRTINWDNWNLGDQGAQGRGRAITEFYMGCREGTDVLGRLLSTTDATQVLVSTGDLQGRIDQWVQGEERPAGRVEAVEKPPVSHAHPRPALSAEYEAPRNDVERALAEIWREMLGIDRVGIHDNFFELGGDSVLNIQITARANQAGIRVTPRQVFEHQTIAELAAMAGAGKGAEIEQDVVTGPVPLTPIQRWFFDRDLMRPEHFNLPMLLEVRRPLDVNILAKVIERLEWHHDGLRSRYSRTEAGWKQLLVEPAGSIKVHKFDLVGLTAAEQERRIETMGTELQTSLDLAKGPLLQVAYFDLGPGHSGRLLFAIHHLIVDMISWRILLEDTQALYESLSKGRDAALPAKTASMKRWAEALTEYAQTKAAEVELGYWLNIGAKPVPRLPIDLEAGANTVGSSASIHEELSVEETRALLTHLPRAYKTQINDALLLALVKAVCGWTGGSSAFVDLEGHGREPILDGIDVSRTVGWFTTLGPVRLELPAARGHRNQISSVQAQLQAVPHHGMGFGVLRYLSTKPVVTGALEKLARPEISYLYMGQFDQAFSSDSLFVPASESVGPVHDPDGERHHLLEFNSMVSQGRLQISWTYSRNRHREETIRSLAQAYMAALRSLIASCRKAEAGHDASSGFKGSGVSDSDLAEIARQLGPRAPVAR